MQIESKIIDKIIQELGGQITFYIDIKPKDPQLFLDLLHEVEITGGDAINNKEELLLPSANAIRVLFIDRDIEAGELRGGGGSIVRDNSTSVRFVENSSDISRLGTFPRIIELSLSIDVGVATKILTAWIIKIISKYYRISRIEVIKINVKSKKCGYERVDLDLIFKLTEELLGEKDLLIEEYNEQIISKNKNIEKIAKIEKKLEREIHAIDDEIEYQINKIIKRKLAKIINKAKREKDNYLI